MPTPIDPISELQEGLEITGDTIILRKQASVDAKRYVKLFKKHVEKNNSHYKVAPTKRDVNIRQETAGNSEVIATFPYKAGVMKALYLDLVLHNYNMDAFIPFVSSDAFVPFSDSEYRLKITPDPQQFLLSEFKQVDGKWH
jgi:hypothetical protein